MIEKLLKKRKLLLICGSGGVGKTTLSAALAIQAALLGKKTLVLTIDPAKRLATSLGIESISGEPKKINLTELKKSSGALYAMMLDTKSTFDSLVTRYAPTEEMAEKIFKNPLYQSMSRMMAGSQEYMAMEKLYEVVSQEKYDLVVIDTPPTVHAMDFLDAPARMMNALNDSMIHLLLKPALSLGKTGFKLFEKGSQMILKVLDKITGVALLKDIAELLGSFRELLDGFKERAAQVESILKDLQTGFVLVSSTTEGALSEALQFKKKLAEMKFNLDGMIFNRVYPDFIEVSSSSRESALEKKFGKKLAEKIQAVFDSYQVKVRHDRESLEKAESSIDKNQFVLSIPLFESDVHDLEGLNALGVFLYG